MFFAVDVTGSTDNDQWSSDPSRYVSLIPTLVLGNIPKKDPDSIGEYRSGCNAHKKQIHRKIHMV